MTRQQGPTVWMYKVPFTLPPFSFPHSPSQQCYSQDCRTSSSTSSQEQPWIFLVKAMCLSLATIYSHGGTNQKVRQMARPSAPCLPTKPRSLRSGVYYSKTMASGWSKASATGASLLRKGHPNTALDPLGPGHRSSGSFELMKEILTIIGTLNSPQVACICSLPDYTIYFLGSILTCLVTVTPPELLFNSSLAEMSRTRSGDSSRLDRVIDCSDASHIG